MISESVIIFGGTGNAIMVVNGPLPKDVPIMFRVGDGKVELVTQDSLIYAEYGLSAYVCQRLQRKNEIGLLEVPDAANPPKHLTSIAYQYAD